MMNAASQRASDPVSTTTIPDRPKLLGRNLASCAVFVGLWSFFFATNTGRWGNRFVFALIGGVVCAVATRATLRLLSLELSRLGQLLTQHRDVLMQRSLWGIVLGAVVGGFLWDFADGALPGLQVAGLVGAIGGAIGFLSFAPQDRCAVNRQSAAEISPPLVSASFLTLVLVNAPRIQVTAENDGSWCAVLNYAHLKGWLFGKDIVFTYGPLGFLTTPWFSSYAQWLRLTTDVALTFSVVLGLCLLVWRVPRLWRYLILAAFVLTSPNIHRGPAPHAGVDLLIPQGLLCWGLLCLLERRPRLWGFALFFTSLAVFGALSKTTFLALSLVSIVAVGCCLCLRGDRKVALAICGLFAPGCVCLWLVLGQKLSHLGSFLIGALAVAAPYDQTMCFPTPIGALRWGAVTAASSFCAAMLACSCTLRTDGESRRVHWLSALWLAFLLFIVWKNGFARGDSYHVETFVGFAVLLALVTSALPAEGRSRTTWAWALAAVSCVAGMSTLKQSYYPGYIGSCLERPLMLLTEKLSTVSQPTRYWQAMARAGEPVRRGAQSTQFKQVIAQSPVDVFGNQQAVALFNGLNYRPRPVFASYAAYSLALMKLNEEFYFSTQAPEFVLFKLDALGDRFPPLEDALLLRDLLVNYDPVASDHGLLVLKAARRLRPELTLLDEATVRPNQPIPLNHYGDADLWMEIEVKPTIAGKTRRLLYNGSGLNLRLWSSGTGGDSATFTAPAPMLSAGFLASPVLLRTQDVADLYNGTPIIRPTACSVELDSGAERWWQQTIRYRVYRIDPLGRLRPESPTIPK